MDQDNFDKLVASTDGMNRDEWVYSRIKALGLDISEEYVKNTLLQLDNKDVETSEPLTN
jgi:hypothetical protein